MIRDLYTSDAVWHIQQHHETCKTIHSEIGILAGR
jgi:hypothetical protein